MTRLCLIRFSLPESSGDSLAGGHSLRQGFLRYRATGIRVDRDQESLRRMEQRFPCGAQLHAMSFQRIPELIAQIAENDCHRSFSARAES
jgi:hypothetical protein